MTGETYPKALNILDTSVNKLSDWIIFNTIKNHERKYYLHYPPGRIVIQSIHETLGLSVIKNIISGKRRYKYKVYVYGVHMYRVKERKR